MLKTSSLNSRPNEKKTKRAIKHCFLGAQIVTTTHGQSGDNMAHSCDNTCVASCTNSSVLLFVSAKKKKMKSFKIVA